MSKFLKVLSSSALALAVMVSAMPALSLAAVEDGTDGTESTYVPVSDPVDIDMQKVFESWVNYPGESYGSAYAAGWVYNSTEGYMNTTENVGWTGFYNPDIIEFTSGIFGFSMKNENFDPCGFAWGIQVSGTEEDPIYSFYAYEECEYSGKWSIAYIEEWHPAKSARSHQGPLYHGTIDAADGEYYHSGTTGYVGFATGTVLAYGDLDTSIKREFHDIVIEVEEDNVKVYINSELLTTVETPVQSGSFGPFATSNPNAYFSNMSFTSTDTSVMEPKFEYRNPKDEAITSAYVGDMMSVVDLSTAEGAEIEQYIWTVTKDGEEIYTGSEPFTGYTKEVGEYVTTLQLVNAYGIRSSVYSLPLTVKNALLPYFTYNTVDENGTIGDAVNNAFVGDGITVVDDSDYIGSPIATYQWVVTLNGEEIYNASEPFADYTKTAGVYTTTLTITNEYGDVTESYSDDLTVSEAPVEESSTPESSNEEPSTPESSIEEPSAPESSSGENFNTGDAASAGILGAVALTAAAAAVVLTLKKRKFDK